MQILVEHIAEINLMYCDRYGVYYATASVTKV
jgi:hypothetical protein